jgi:uncharacterized protein (DUF1697 family)
MTSYVALLRAVNVGGTGKLAMSDLKKICEDAGFRNVRTYIASGNVVFESGRSEKDVKRMLENRLLEHAGRPVNAIVRNADEMAEVLARNPFPDAPGNRTVAIFLDAAPPPDALNNVSGRVDEEIASGSREIYVRYGADMGHSKLRIPAAKAGTARNMNTVAKLAAMAGESDTV